MGAEEVATIRSRELADDYDSREAAGIMTCGETSYGSTLYASVLGQADQQICWDEKKRSEDAKERDTRS